MTIDVTATVVVAGAIASRDFMPVHHDRDWTSALAALAQHLHEHHHRQTVLPQLFPDGLGGAGGVWAEDRDPTRRSGVRGNGCSKFRERSPASRSSTARAWSRSKFRAVNDQGDHVSGTARRSAFRSRRPGREPHATRPRRDRRERPDAVLEGVGRSELQLACDVYSRPRSTTPASARATSTGARHLHDGPERGDRRRAGPRNPGADDVLAHPDGGGAACAVVMQAAMAIATRGCRRHRPRTVPSTSARARASAVRAWARPCCCCSSTCTGPTACSRRRAGWRCTRAAGHAPVRRHERALWPYLRRRPEARGDEPGPRGSTSARSRSRSTSARAGIVELVPRFLDLLSRNATAASRSSSRRASAHVICASHQR